MNLIGLATQLDEHERVEREALEDGCARDLGSIDRFLAGPLRNAQIDLEAELLSVGALDPALRRNLLTQAAEEITVRRARDAFVNADVRFRARFSINASALAEAKQRFLEAAKAAIDADMRLRPQRRIIIPHLELEDDLSIVPRCEVSSSTIDDWIDELRSNLRQAIANAVDNACRSLVKRGSASIARARVGLRLATHGRNVTL
jgi:hypothetical protein